MSINAPCRNCPERHLGCHSDCTLYKEFKVELAEVNRRKIACKSAEYEYLKFKKKRKH